MLSYNDPGVYSLIMEHILPLQSVSGIKYTVQILVKICRKSGLPPLNMNTKAWGSVLYILIIPVLFWSCISEPTVKIKSQRLKLCTCDTNGKSRNNLLVEIIFILPLPRTRKISLWDCDGCRSLWVTWKYNLLLSFNWLRCYTF